MYLTHWNIREFPFENVPDPRFLYLSPNHEEALSRILYAAHMRKGAALLSGEVGCGKTTLSKVFIQELEEERFDVALIVNPNMGPVEFLKAILFELDEEARAENKVDLLNQLNAKMLSNLKAGRETLVVIDEAQAMLPATFEEVRMLLNFQLNDRFLLTLVLLGQPELRALVKQIKQLDQRIAIRFHLEPFDINEAARYIIFRLKRVGMKKNPFTRQAVELIFKATGGVPRKINTLCDLALLEGYFKKMDKVDSAIIKKIIKEMN